VLKLLGTGGALALAISASVALPANAQSEGGAAVSRERDANQAASAIYQTINGKEAAARPSPPEQHNSGKSGGGIAGGGEACTPDGLIHAEVSSVITKRVADLIHPLDKGVQVRDPAKLVLPCGFHIDGRYGWNLILNNGAEVRRYVENNPFGFAPAFGFAHEVAKSYALQYHPVAKGELYPDDCTAKLKAIQADLKLCSGFGGTSLFATKVDGRRTRLAHYVSQGAALQEDFAVAQIDGEVDSIFFLPPPDAPGGTITLILHDRQGTYRVFLDTAKG